MDKHIKLKEIMVKEVITAIPDETVAIAAKRMREQRIGCLVVVHDGETKGIITDRDLLDCIAAGHEAKRCKLSNHMSTPVITCKADNDLLPAAQLMSERKIKRLPIVEKERLVGLVSFSDISLLLYEEAGNMWSEWNQICAVTRAQARHWRGERQPKQI